MAYRLSGAAISYKSSAARRIVVFCGHTRNNQDIQLPCRHGGDVVLRGRDVPILRREGLRVTCLRSEDDHKHLILS